MDLTPADKSTKNATPTPAHRACSYNGPYGFLTNQGVVPPHLCFELNI